MKLTAQVIKNLVHPGGKSDVVFWDEQIPNFGIRIYPSGKKAFVMMYSIRGRLRRHTLGQYPKITLHDARKMALEGLGMIAKGIDPSRPESNLSKPRTMNELLKRYLNTQ